MHALSTPMLVNPYGIDVLHELLVAGTLVENFLTKNSQHFFNPFLFNKIKKDADCRNLGFSMRKEALIKEPKDFMQIGDFLTFFRDISHSFTALTLPVLGEVVLCEFVHREGSFDLPIRIMRTLHLRFVPVDCFHEPLHETSFE